MPTVFMGSTNETVQVVPEGILFLLQLLLLKEFLAKNTLFTSMHTIFSGYCLSFCAYFCWLCIFSCLLLEILRAPVFCLGTSISCFFGVFYLNNPLPSFLTIMQVHKKLLVSALTFHIPYYQLQLKL